MVEFCTKILGMELTTTEIEIYNKLAKGGKINMCIPRSYTKLSTAKYYTGKKQA